MDGDADGEVGGAGAAVVDADEGAGAHAEFGGRFDFEGAGDGGFFCGWRIECVEDGLGGGIGDAEGRLTKQIGEDIGGEVGEEGLDGGGAFVVAGGLGAAEEGGGEDKQKDEPRSKRDKGGRVRDEGRGLRGAGHGGRW